MGKPLNMELNRVFRLTALLFAAAVLPSTSAVLAQDASSLPGGASSLQETYQDWRVFCQVLEATKHCGVVTLSFSGRKDQGLVDIHAKQAAIFHASKASRRW